MANADDLAALLEQITLRDKKKDDRIAELEAELEELKKSVAIVVRTVEQDDISEPTPEPTPEPSNDTTPTRRKYRCKLCGEEGHNLRTCNLRHTLLGN
jgi:hypothetical protein